MANDAPIQFPLLQMLILTNCRALEELPLNIGLSVPRLKTMEMDKCSLIAVLPDSVGQLKDLENLNLTGCETLRALPDTIVHLAKLKKLLLDGCYQLDCLPSSIGGLGMLKELQMKNTGVKDLPEDFGQLTRLTSLSLYRLRNVPENFGGLNSLAILLLSFEVLDRSERLASSLGALTALKTLHLSKFSNITALPRSFGDLKSLVKLEMVNASTLVTIEVLPQSLQHLDLGHCSQRIKVPSFAEMNSLVFLNLSNCSSLTQIHGLECLTSLEDINLSGVTSLSDCVLVVQSGRNRALRNCCLSGSKVAVAYDNRWLEEEPALQLISYYNDSIGYFPNGLACSFVNQEWAFEVLMGATISTEAKCVALIFCFVAHNQGWPYYPNKKHRPYWCSMEVHIMREGKVVSGTALFSLRHIVNNCNQVFLWTLRREHPVLQLLQLGDRICVYVRSRMTVLEGALCVVHAENDHLTLALNSKLLSKSDSEKFATKLGQLFLADDFHLLLRSKLEIDTELDSKLGNLLANDELDSINEDAANPDSTFEILLQRGWLIAPAYGHYHWTHSWKLPREDQGIISFKAEGKNNVHVAIFEHCNNVSSKSRMYEIVIGCWGNTSSLIQRYRGKQAGKYCCSVATGFTS